MARRASPSPHASGKQPPLDLDLIRQAAATRWPEILAALTPIPRDHLDGQHHPCALCGGQDRFRLIDAAAGAVLCNQCHRDKNGDGFATVQKYAACDFRTAAGKIADYLGIDAAATAGGQGGSRNGKHTADPAEHLTFQPWDDLLAGYWCLAKPPITPSAILAAGGQLATYRGQWQVVAFPVFGSIADNSAPVGWVIANRTGGTLPTWAKGEKQPKWRKVKNTHGSERGLLGQVAALADSSITTVWWVEGYTDLAAALSASPPPGHAIIANPFGAGEKVPQWVLDALQGKEVNVVGDRDKLPPSAIHPDGAEPGPAGAEKRAAALAAASIVTRNVILPYPLVVGQKKDLRDYFSEGHSFAELIAIAAATEPVTAIEADATLAAAVDARAVNEADDDPHRLARVNLANYAADNSGRTLRYWRSEWYVWKETHYRKIPGDELKAKIGYAIKEEFDRLNREALDQWEQRLRSGVMDDAELAKGPPQVRKVTTNIISNVILATAGITNLSSAIEPMTWLPTRERKSYIALRNGILDIDALMADREAEDCILPHSPDWFSTVCLPYDFDPHATCPKWEAFLERNLELDPERIKLLQEWAGYLLLPDTGMQRFLVLEGEGANGKSVYCAAINAMLGNDNVSHVPLEIFGVRFALTETLGKLVNIAADCGDLDKVAEGHLKSFTSGDGMFFDRKGVAGITAIPTARLVMAVNNRPRFSDRSDGVWRRMLLVPWRIQIAPEERIPNMDKPWWWEHQGELPGILIWAIRGLARLRQQGQFTRSQLCEEAMEDYKAEVNPARKFLTEHLEKCDTAIVPAQQLYDHYVAWTARHGNRPLADGQFGKEVMRAFRLGKRERPRIDGKRIWVYSGVAYQQDKGPTQKADGQFEFT